MARVLICDVCDKNVANTEYKTKRKYESKWACETIRVHICNECHIKLFGYNLCEAGSIRRPSVRKFPPPPPK